MQLLAGGWCPWFLRKERKLNSKGLQEVGVESLQAKSSYSLMEQAWNAYLKMKPIDPNVFSTYRGFVKSLPFMIINNGLISTCTYLESRSGNNKVAANYLVSQISDLIYGPDHPIDKLMNKLVGEDSIVLRRKTGDVMTFLKWLRQFVDIGVQHE